MNDSNTDSGRSKTGSDSVFLYKDSGIKEKPGSIPLWLLAVVAILFIWGIYYLVAFWSPPPA